MINITQENHRIVSTSKTIDWLVNNTTVSTFDSVSFEGYQRQIDEKHCLKIVDYLKKTFWMPSAIICACDKEYTDDVQLRVVDGQHRVQAFRLLNTEDPSRFNEISHYEVPVVVLVNVPKEVEIETFITINKTSKKVDTSLAYVLKNKLSRQPENMAMSKSEYIAVEVARILNEESNSSLWNNAILYEGSVKQTDSMISLNSFVRATRVFVGLLDKLGVISLNWSTEDEASQQSRKVSKLIQEIWNTVAKKWPDLFNKSFEVRSIVQGSIGYTSITRTLVKLMRSEDLHDTESVISFCERIIMCMDVDSSNWYPGNVYSRFSSEAGYRFVSDDLIKNLRK